MRLLVVIAMMTWMLSATAPAASWKDQYTLTVWDAEAGMPGNEVRTVLQDDSGFLWVATPEGIARFDGLQFEALRSSMLERDLPPQVDSGIKYEPNSRLIKDRPNSLLMAQDRRRVLQLKDNTLTVHPVTSSIRPGQQIVALFSEENDVFWIVFADQETWRWSHGKIEVFPVPEAGRAVWQSSFARTNDGKTYIVRRNGIEVYEGGDLKPAFHVPMRQVCIHAARTGGLWVGMAGQLCRWENGIMTEIATLPVGAVDWAPTAMRETRDGALWLGIKGQGLFRWQSGVLSPVHTSHRMILDLIEDDEGCLWAATGSGLDRIRHARFTVLAQAESDTVGSICEDALGNIWLTNSNGIWLLRDEGIELALNQKLWSRGAHTVCPDGSGNVWCGGNRNLFKVQAGTDGPLTRMQAGTRGDVWSLFRGRDNRMWVGTSGELLCFQDKERTAFGPAHGFVGSARAIAEDTSGNLWIGTESGTLYRLKDDHFESHRLETNTKASPILALHGDMQGTLWIGTESDGLFVRHDGNFLRIGQHEGLPEGAMAQILEDDFGRLWFGTSRGLFSVSKADLLDCATGKRASIAPSIYGRSDGVAGFHATSFGQPGAWKGADGRLWFAGRNGVVTTAPSQGASNQPTPRIVLQEFLVDGKPTDARSSPLLSTSRKFEFRYTAPTFVAPEDVRFRYRLKGVDSAWTEAGSQRQAVFSRLVPGEYEFEVTAAHRNQEWNPVPAVRKFSVLPVWWETGWARLGAAILALAIVVGSVHFWLRRRYKARLTRLQQEHRIDQERARIAQDLHDDLGGSLTEIAMLSELAQASITKPERLGEHLNRIFTSAQDGARALDEIVWAADPKDDQLDRFVDYLSQSLQVFAESAGVRSRLELPGTLPKTEIAAPVRYHLYLAAKEALHNTIKHADATEIRLGVSIEGDILCLSLTDNGKGFDPNAPGADGADGLANMRHRINEIGGVFHLRSEPGKGTTVEFRCRYQS